MIDLHVMHMVCKTLQSVSNRTYVAYGLCHTRFCCRKTTLDRDACDSCILPGPQCAAIMMSYSYNCSFNKLEIRLTACMDSSLVVCAQHMRLVYTHDNLSFEFMTTS